jgi:DNA gyrase subunit A
VLVTRRGNIKRVGVEDLNGRTDGSWGAMIGLLDDSDEVILAGIASDQAQVMLVTAGTEKTTPRALRFEAGSVNPQATPSAKGVGAMKMLDDPVIGGALIEPKLAAKSFAVVVTEKGQVKRVKLDDFPVQGRGGQGVQLWKVTPASGMVSGFAVATPETGDLDFYSNRGRRLRLALKDVPASARATKGVSLADLIKGDDVFGSDTVAGVVAVS